MGSECSKTLSISMGGLPRCGHDEDPEGVLRPHIVGYDDSTFIQNCIHCLASASDAWDGYFRFHDNFGGNQNYCTWYAAVNPTSYSIRGQAFPQKNIRLQAGSPTWAFFARCSPDGVTVFFPQYIYYAVTAVNTETPIGEYNFNGFDPGPPENGCLPYGDINPITVEASVPPP